MKILVTGASGYLGGRLCNALLHKGYSIRVLARRTSDLSALASPADAGALEIVYGDVTDYASLLSACSGCHIIFHLAAVVEPWLPDPSKLFSVNVGGLKNLLEAVKQTKTVEKIIYTSSFFALGPTDGSIADENQVHHEKFFCTEYEKTKVAADKIALQATSEGIPLVAVYPGVVYGPGKVTTGNIVCEKDDRSFVWFLHMCFTCQVSYTLGIGSTIWLEFLFNERGFIYVKYVAKIIERFNGRLPGYIGYGNDRFSFSHVDDVVEGHIAVMEKGQPGNRYLLTGENASLAHVLDIAAVITNTRRPFFNIPLWVVEAYGWLSVLFSRITGKLPLISPPTVCVLRRRWEYSCDKAKGELDYRPRSLKDGLPEVLLWLKNLGFISY